MLSCGSGSAAMRNTQWNSQQIFSLEHYQLATKAAPLAWKQKTR
ncbi:hypothetical protein BN2497_1465 [Janthinobacterium sp. CG23_2]|nr:hypothetical protein BN2497_1465 [Janthinobacterium sp. CG23_2]CUU27130.1 hypothetical protein BN3177_1465 [Janthinobacterium sp. CG23_2]